MAADGRYGAATVTEIRFNVFVFVAFVVYYYSFSERHTSVTVRDVLHQIVKKKKIEKNMFTSFF